MTAPFERIAGPGEDGLVVWRVTGATLPELFERAGVAVFATTWDPSGVPPRYSRPLVAPGDTMDELLANWLEELIAMAETESLAISYVTVDRLEEGGVQGSAAGMPRREAPPTGPPVLGLETPPQIVTLPDGHWVDIAVRVAPRLRAV